MHKLIKAAATGGLALALVTGGSLGAFADETPTTTEEVASSTAQSPDTATAPSSTSPVAEAQAATASPVTATDPGSSTEGSTSSNPSSTPSSTTDPSQSESGSPSADSASPSPTTVPDESSTVSIPAFHAALWAASLNLEPKFPQSLVHDVVTDSTDLHALLDQFAVCQPDVPTTYQGDLYANDEITDATIGGKILHGGDESWPGGEYKSEFSFVVTVPACEPPVVVPPAAEVCAVVGGQYTESDDHSPIDVAEGKQFTSQGDRTPIEFGYPVTGNLQGVNSITWNASNVVGNGIFFRFVIDLTGDGLGAYNSLSITDGTVTQASTANVGSKSVFLGKTIAEIAALYPHNKISSVHFQTGSSYAAGDGATLTSVKGDCFDFSYAQPPVIVTPPADDPTPTATPVAEVEDATPAAAVVHEKLASTGAGDATGALGVAGLVAVLLGVPLLLIRRRIASK